jgi:integrase/recombinase XerD
MKKEYLDWKKTYLGPQSFRSYRLWIDRLGEYIKDLTDFEGYSKFMEAIKEKYAPKNVEFGLSIVHNYFEYCVANGVKCISPFMIKVPKCRGKVRKATTEEEYRTLIEYLPTNEFVPLRDSIILRIMNDTGARLSEVLAIDFKNLDEYSALVPTRKRKEWRTIYWSEETKKLLFEKYIPIRICLDNLDDALFVSKYGEGSRGRITPHTFQVNLRRTCQALGIKTTAHEFRHKKALDMRKQSAPLQDIATILGHANIASSMKYLNMTIEEDAELARKYLV